MIYIMMDLLMDIYWLLIKLMDANGLFMRLMIFDIIEWTLKDINSDSDVSLILIDF